MKWICCQYYLYIIIHKYGSKNRRYKLSILSELVKYRLINNLCGISIFCYEMFEYRFLF